MVKGTSVLKVGESAFQLKTSFNQRLERELGQMRRCMPRTTPWRASAGAAS